MKQAKMVLAMLTAGLFVFQGVSYAQHDHQKPEDKSPPSQQQVKETYTCPMHPDVISDKPGKCPKCGMTLEKKKVSALGQQEKMSAMMGKPTFEKSVEGVQVQVWLITQDEHKRTMGSMMGDKKDSSTGGGMMHGEMKHDMNKMDHGMMGQEMKHETDSAGHMKRMEAMMAGTHHVMVTLTDEKSNQSMDKEKVTIKIGSPSGKSNNVELSSMMNHFGGGLTLGEKGTYSLNILIEDAQKTRTITVPYEVK